VPYSEHDLSLPPKEIKENGGDGAALPHTLETVRLLPTVAEEEKHNQ